MIIFLSIIGSLWFLWLIGTGLFLAIAIYAPASPAVSMDRLDIWLRRAMLMASLTFGILFVCSIGINLMR